MNKKIKLRHISSEEVEKKKKEYLKSIKRKSKSPLKLEIKIKDVTELNPASEKALYLFLACESRKWDVAKQYLKELKEELENPGLLKYCKKGDDNG